ncbi:DNA-binding protein [Escherichia sp. E10V10]|uniref:helix-turn-helix domain-containing protein n=1 Tax=unclassified Escherichia TaxID=2608889 RepID=UPI001028F7ED|nr:MULTISPECIES: helix-turn-helix domain-containing protein [unclassified Escherichia]RZN44174.1 DNA-binding protein [Escherichia sp. E10V10]TGB89247.1 hypothetical protein CRG94_23620 [Escherichia sp. E3356]
MARVSISEAARLASVSRPTIYKLLKSGELSYTSVVKHGKSVKIIDTTELMRVFGTLNLDSERDSSAVTFDDRSTGINSEFLQDLQHQVALLQAENAGLKDAVNARDEHISSLRQAMQLLEHKQPPSEMPEPTTAPWWKFWQK